MSEPSRTPTSWNSQLSIDHMMRTQINLFFFFFFLYSVINFLKAMDKSFGLTTTYKYIRILLPGSSSRQEYWSGRLQALLQGASSTDAGISFCVILHYRADSLLLSLRWQEYCRRALYPYKQSERVMDGKPGPLVFTQQWGVALNS